MTSSSRVTASRPWSVRTSPDLVLSDVLMPGMDGFTLCRCAHEDAALRHLPFVFMSGTFADPRYAQFAAALGAVEVLSKPIDSRSLRAAVDRALRRRAVARPFRDH
jgi:CheY-like chemotaxis protein